MRGRAYVTRHIVLVALAALMLAGPAAAQSVSISATPHEASAPAQLALSLGAEPAIDGPWRVTAHLGDQMQVLAVGQGLPAQRNATLGQPGQYMLRLVAENSGLSAETFVNVTDNPVAAALQGLAIRIDEAPSLGRAFTIHLDNPSDVAASWDLLLVDGADATPLTSGTSLPASVEIRLDEEGSFGLLLFVNADGQVIERSGAFEVGPKVYDSLVAGDALPLIFAGLLMLGLAAWLLIRDRTRPINIAFAALFIARGVADIVLALWANTGAINIRPGEGLDAATGGLARHLHPITSVTVLFAALFFLYAYLAQNNARLAIRHRVVALAASAGALLFIGLYFLVPSIWWVQESLHPGGWLFTITGIYYPLYAVFALLLFRESVKDIPDDRRTGAFYSGLGFLFLPVFTGAGEFLFVDILDFFGRLEAAGGLGRDALGAGFELGHWAAVLALVPVVWAGVVLGKESRTNPERAGSRLHFILYLVAVILPLASLGVAAAVFFVGSDELLAAGRSLAVFNIFQGIWTIPYPVLVAYGITRYQASGEQTKMRQQIRRFGMASIFFTVFFAVSEGLEAFASSRFGPAVGLGSAAGLTLILGPLQEKLQQRVSAHEAPPEQETHQELKFYREQVRRTLIDGHIGDVERKFLLNLQDTMGITTETAADIERELVAERAASGAPMTVA